MQRGQGLGVGLGRRHRQAGLCLRPLRPALDLLVQARALGARGTYIGRAFLYGLAGLDVSTGRFTVVETDRDGLAARLAAADQRKQQKPIAALT